MTTPANREPADQLAEVRQRINELRAQEEEVGDGLANLLVMGKMSMPE
ncbi:hypothetical protein JQ625_24035 [Bradyrhizobium diazoefficiens]|nr:hypothetical protein [Bradyrhizobium diazoefficiens]MBR0777913.1 hypothetical protein [Bradyrhizobium diazoefficiens]